MRQTNNQQPKTSSGYHISLILLGIAIPPVLIASSKMGVQLGKNNLLIAVLISGLILTLLSTMTMLIGERARLSTYEIIKFPFGQKGALLINILMAISLLGWIIVTANQFGQTIYSLLTEYNIKTIPLSFLIILGCVLFTLATTFGFSILGKIASLIIPIIAIILAYLIIKILGAPTNPAVISNSQPMKIGVAISTIIGTIIVLVTTSADFGSLVHNRKHAVIATVLTFMLVYPLLFWAGAIPGQLTGKESLTDAARLFSLAVPAAVLMLLATFTGNLGNMFQGTLVFSTLFPKITKWKITVGIGIISAIVANLNILSWFIPFLLFLAIAVPPIAGIYITDFILYRRKKGYFQSSIETIRIETIIAWLIGFVIGFLSIKGLLTLTMIPSIDSILLSSLSYALFSKLSKK